MKWTIKFVILVLFLLLEQQSDSYNPHRTFHDIIELIMFICSSHPVFNVCLVQIVRILVLFKTYIATISCVINCFMNVYCYSLDVL